MHHHRRPRGRRALLVVLAVVAVLACLVGLAPPASAHATVVSTDPAAGAVLEVAPDQIGFTFSEPVSTVPGGVQVFDAEGGVIASSASADDVLLSVALTGPVSDGTLVVTYRVVSQDGHPISGSLIFSVGAPSARIQEPPRTDAGTTGVPWGLTALRFVGYVGLFLAAGLIWFAALVLPRDRATEVARRRLAVAARVAGGVAGVAWLASLPVTASYQSGGGVTWSALATTEYVVAGTVTLGVGLALLLLARGAGRAAVVAAGLATVAPALTGHTRATTPQALAIGADLLHLLAGSIWLGGLVALAIVLAELSGRGTLAGEVLARFSTVAAGVLGALVVTGSLLSWRILGSWGGLVDTTYGRLLLVKIGAGIVVVAIAAYNRGRLMPRLQAATHRKDRRTGAGLVARAVAGEGAVLVVVLLVTGFLVDRNPDGDPVVPASSVSRATTRTDVLGEITAEVTISRQTPGPTVVTVELLDDLGTPTEGYATPSATFTSDDVDLGAVPLRNNGPGRYEADVVIPAPGVWTFELGLQTDATDTARTSLDFDILG